MSNIEGMRTIKKPRKNRQRIFWENVRLIYDGDIGKAGFSKFILWHGQMMFDKMMASKGAISFYKFRKLAINLGVRMYPCQIVWM